MVERITTGILYVIASVFLSLLAILLFIGSPVLGAMYDADRGFHRKTLKYIVFAPGYMLVAVLVSIRTSEIDELSLWFRASTVVVSILYWLGVGYLAWLIIQPVLALI